MIIVTGGSSGTGYATCKALYENGATVYLACRSFSRGREAIEAIEKGREYTIAGLTYPNNGEKKSGKGKGKLICLELDLADLESVETFAKEFQT